MRTTILFLLLTITALILLSFPEESNAVIFVLSHGKVARLKQKVSRVERKKRRKGSHKDKNRKKRKQAQRRKIKELKRWLARFAKKNKSTDNGDGIMKKKRIWTSKRKSLL